MSIDDEAGRMWRRMRAAQERKLEAEALSPQTQALHQRLAEMHERALSDESYTLQVVGKF